MTKPRKKYRPRPANVPLMVVLQTGPVDADSLAFKLHAAILTMIQRPSTDACNNLTERLCSLTIALSMRNGGGIPLDGRDGHIFRALQSAIRVIEDIIDRRERTGVLGVADPEATSLHAAAQVLDPHLGLIPEALYAAAERIVGKRMDKAMAEVAA